MSSPSGVRGGAQAENGLISTDRLCSQQVTANSSPFCPEKWGNKGGATDGCGEHEHVPSLLGLAGYMVQRGRSNENDLCFYGRQSLFSKVGPTSDCISSFNSPDSSRHLPS